MFGGTFDPVHVGHLIAAYEASGRLGLDRVLLVPAGQPQLRETAPVAAAHHRLAMAQLATQADDLLAVSDVEARRPGPSYTVDTLEELRNGSGDADRYYLIVGADALRDLRRWHNARRIFEMAHLVALARPGYETPEDDELEAVRTGAARQVILIDGPMIEISSSAIRSRLAEGLPIRYWVPEAVKRYIGEHRLYNVDLGE